MPARKLDSPGRPGPRFHPPLGSSQWVLSYLFPRVGASQAREKQIAATTTPRKTVQTTFCTVSCMFFHKILPTPCFWKCACMFCNVFLQNTVFTHLSPSNRSKTSLFTMFPIPLSPQTLKSTAIYIVFFNFSMFQYRWPIQTYIQKLLRVIPTMTFNSSHLTIYLAYLSGIPSGMSSDV